MFADATEASTSIATAIEVIEACAVDCPDDIYVESAKVSIQLTDYKDYKVGKSTKCFPTFLCPVAAYPYVSAWHVNSKLNHE